MHGTKAELNHYYSSYSLEVGHKTPTKTSLKRCGRYLEALLARSLITSKPPTEARACVKMNFVSL